MKHRNKVILWAFLLVLVLVVLFLPYIFLERAPITKQEPGAVWKVSKGGREVLIVKNEPGHIVSTALLPEGQEPVKHPFLSATALDPFEEDNLHTILDKAQNFEEFLRLLRYNGYRLEKDDK